MAAQINEIYSNFHMIENLLSDLAPALGKIAKDTHPHIKDLREKFERDETLDLIKKVGDNIPTFLQLFDMMKIVQGMMTDLMPAVGKIADDASPVIKDMRERFEREETLSLLMKIGDNIPTFLQLFDMMKIVQGMMTDLMPAVGKIADAQTGAISSRPLILIGFGWQAVIEQFNQVFRSYVTERHRRLLTLAPSVEAAWEILDHLSY